MMKILVALNILFYSSKFVRIATSYFTLEESKFITPESCPTTTYTQEPALMLVTYVSTVCSIFSQLSLVCVLNIILDNASFIGATEDFSNSKMHVESHTSNVPYV